MNVTFDYHSQISPLRAVKFAVCGEKASKSASQPQDTMELSRAGLQAAAKPAEEPAFSRSWEALEERLGSMSKDEFMSMVREHLGEEKLEVNWNATVDPDGQIWCRAYFDSYASQVTAFRDTAEGAIRSYYAGPYQEALSSPLGRGLPSQLNFLAAKYQCSWTDCFDASMPADQRQWTYTQVRAMLTGSGLRLNDPYALNGIHIPTVEETARISKQTADDKISTLVRQAKEAEGIMD